MRRDIVEIIRLNNSESDKYLLYVKMLKKQNNLK
jgi:hypothetical protein